MKYLLSLYDSPDSDLPAPGTPAFEAYMAPWEEYTNALSDAGVLRGGEALEDDGKTTVVRAPDGVRQIQDGPFLQAKEQLGGFYLIEVPDLDTALEWAAKCPAAATGAVEVRPVWDLGG